MDTKQTPPAPLNPSHHTSSLYRELLAEKDEVLRHKWLESEKAGRDIGIDKSLLDWNTNHREKWRRARWQQRNAAPPPTN
ncbi:MAG: DUF4032 domain-containing protein [Puniceicoccales bacterium]|jgi:hypothetical protein|nr:DUF4032 domain-containing protein [Puniceicoccales bacterium]